MLFLNLSVMVALQVLPLQSFFIRSPFSSKGTKAMFQGTKSMFGSDKPFPIKFPNFWTLIFPPSGSKNMDGTMGQDKLVPFLFLRPPPPQYHVPDENVITFEDELKLSTEEELGLYQSIGENIHDYRNPSMNVVLNQLSPPHPIDINIEAGFSSHHKVFHQDEEFPQNMLHIDVNTNQQIANLHDQNRLNELINSIPSGVYFRPNRDYQGGFEVVPLTDFSPNDELTVSNNINNNIQVMSLNDDEMNSVGLSPGKDKNDARLRPILFPDHQHDIVAPVFENESDNIEKQTFYYESGFHPMNKPFKENMLMMNPKPNSNNNEWTGINRPKQQYNNLVPQSKPVRNKFDGSSGKQVGFPTFVVQAPSMHAASMFAYPIHTSSVSRRGVRETYPYSIDRTDARLSDFTYIPIKKVIPIYIHLKAYKIEY